MVEKGNRTEDAVRWMRWGLLLIFLVSGPLHFAFEGLGRPYAAAAVLPVNESVFEHLKLAFWPLLLWWILVYVFRIRRDKTIAARWLFSGSAAVFAAPLFIMVYYYTYTGAFGIHSLLLDVLSLPFSLLLAHFLAAHLYRYARVPRWSGAFFLLTALTLVAVFVLFTYQPPEIPLFRDSSTGRYGLN